MSNSIENGSSNQAGKEREPWHIRYGLNDPPQGFHWDHIKLSFHAYENHSGCDKECFELVADNTTTQAIIEGEALSKLPEALRKKMEGIEKFDRRFFG